MPKGRIPVVSGGFDPLHSGHIALLKGAFDECKKPVVVLLNSDEWLTRKKGKPFMPFEERKAVLDTNVYVGAVYAFDDSDDSAVKGLEMLNEKYPHAQLIFCNGGDRTEKNIPEMSCNFAQFRFGIGGKDKKNSSSWLLRDAIAQHKEDRQWGSFVDLYQTQGCKVKELIIKPGKSISYQRHFHRSEVWYVRSGAGIVRRNIHGNAPYVYTEARLNKDDVHVVYKDQWHKLTNPFEEDLVIIEIQYGEKTSEDDIERILDESELVEIRKKMYGNKYAEST